MTIFTPSHLGKWEGLYRDLLEGERVSLTPEGTWMLADKPGIVAVFNGDEIVYIAAAKSIVRSLQTWLKGGATSEFRTLVAAVDLGVPARSAESRAKNGRISQRVDKVVPRLRYRVVQAPPSQLEGLALAFTAVADPRYNGPTSRANLAIDALPK